MLVDEPLMLLPGGIQLDDRSLIVDSMGGVPWDSYDLEDMRVVPLGEGAAVVAYGATAARGDTQVSSLSNSTYVRSDGRWRLAVHQQTPR